MSAILDGEYFYNEGSKKDDRCSFLAVALEARNRFDKEITTPAKYAHPRIPDGSHEWRN